MNNKVITMTAWRRVEYTKTVLENLKQCSGFKNYLLLPTIEPGYPEVIKLFDDISNCEVIVNSDVLGNRLNSLKALQRGFDISDFVIHIEDDTVPGVDSLKYFEWASERYKDDKTIFAVTAYNKTHSIHPDNYFTVYRHQWFTAWLWGTWKDRFKEMEKNWDYSRLGWDHSINKMRGERYELCPNLSRSHNIGEKYGTNATPHIWKKVHYNPIWVNSVFNMKDLNFEYPLYSEIEWTDNIQQELSYNSLSMFLEENKSYIIGAGLIGLIGISLYYNKFKNKR